MMELTLSEELKARERDLRDGADVLRSSSETWNLST